MNAFTYHIKGLSLLFGTEVYETQMPVSPHLWATIRILRTMHIEQRCNFYQSMPIPLMVHISSIRADTIHVAPMSTLVAIAFRSKKDAEMDILLSCCLNVSPGPF
jgi:hypothetical protein